MRLSHEQQQLVEDSLGLVNKVIKDKVHGIDGIGIFTYDDLFQIGCIGLCKAAFTDKYQYAYNRENTHSDDRARFSTYAYRLIWNEICTKLIYATKVRIESAVAPEDLMPRIRNGQDQMDDGFGDAELRTALDGIMDAAASDASGVTAKGIQAIRYMAQGYTSTEIARMMGGISCHNVTAWVSKARKYLKSYPDLVKLMSSA